MGKTILFLIDAWSSVAGGIQTVNRELCLALASYCKEPEGEQIHIVCICKDCSEEDRQNAEKGGVTLMKADELKFFNNDEESRILEILFHTSLRQATGVVSVVGHAKFTGKAAKYVRDTYFPEAKVVTTYGELVKKCPLPQPYVDLWLRCDTPAGQQRSWP